MTIRRNHRLAWALMTVALSGAVSACFSTTAAEGAPDRSILFIGNSLTSSNNLPAMVALVARTGNDAVRVDMAVRANTAVIDHTGGASGARAKIGVGAWGFVVLQQGPTPAGVCRDTLIIAAMRLAPKIRAAGGRPVLFLPWARQAAPELLPVSEESARLAARAVGGVVAPVGIAWKRALDADPGLPLYSGDGYHPAPAGTLLAALTIYDRLFARDVRDISAETLAALSGIGLTSSQIKTLSAAAHAASDSLPADPPTPVATDTTTVSMFGGPC